MLSIFIKSISIKFIYLILRIVSFILSYCDIYLPPLPGNNNVSSQWFTHILKYNNILVENQSVETILINKCNGGMTDSVIMLDIKYLLPINNLSKQILPSKFLLKFKNDISLISIINQLTTGHYREAKFYEEINNTLSFSGFKLPKVYYTLSNKFLALNIIIMDDIVEVSKPSSAYIVDKIFKSYSTDPTNIKVVLNQSFETQESILKTIFKNAATIHAKYWNDSSLLKKTWLKGANWYNNCDREVWELALENTKRAWNKTKSAYLSGDIKYNFSSKLFDIIETAFSRSSWTNLQNFIKSSPFSLTHGDFHSGNMIWRTSLIHDSTSLFLFDWSEVGIWQPMADLAQMIISDVKPELWKSIGKSCLKEYHDCLLEKGKLFNSDINLSFDECVNYFYNGGIERWIFINSILLSIPLGPVVHQYFHDQLVQYIELSGEENFDIKSMVPLVYT